MPTTIAMTEKGHDAIRERLEALDLDIAVWRIGDDGRVLVDGTSKSPEELDVDYLWFSVDISADRRQAEIFDLARKFRSIKVLQTFNAGLDNPIYSDLSKRGVRVCNSSAQGVAISEYVFAFLLNHYHPMQLRAEQQASKTWATTRFREIAKSHILILGYGPIGQGIAKRAKAFDATGSVVRRSPQTSDIVDQCGTLEDLPELLPQADTVVLACPMNAQTANVADARFFDAMKGDALLINIARGGLVDDDALIAALDGDQIGGAVLDVFREEPLPPTSPYWTHPKVTMTGHTSHAGSGGVARWQNLFLENIAQYVRTGELTSEVSPADLA